MAESREGLWMSAKEWDRLKVLHEVRKRHITQKQAASWGLACAGCANCWYACEQEAIARCGTGCAGDPRIGKRRKQ